MAASMQTRWRWQLLVLAACAVLLAGCRQAPALSGGMFSPGGQHFAYVYRVTWIHSYQRSGGRTVSSGSFRSYLQVIDTDSGRKLLDRPLRPDCGYPRIGDVNESHVLVTCMAAGRDTREKPAPFVFDLATGKVRVDSGTVAERNPGGLLGGADSTLRDPAAPEAFILEGNDGRNYRLDPSSGVATVTSGELVRLESGISGFHQACHLPAGLHESGGTRRYVERDKALRSQDDFLDPQYLCVDSGHRDSLAAATDIEGGLLVLSRTSTQDAQDKRLTLLDRSTLKTRWSTPLPQPRGDWAGRFDSEKFVRRGRRVLVANASRLLDIDLASGRILRDTALVD